MSVAKELRTEVENLAARLHYMEEAKEDVRADIAVMRRAAEKADTEVTKAETEKKKQVQCGQTEQQPKAIMSLNSNTDLKVNTTVTVKHNNMNE